LYFEWVAGKIQERGDILNDGFERMGWAANKPQAGMFVWAKLPDPLTKMGSMDFTLQLIQKANVAVAPGVGFGEEGEGYLRMALVENEHRIRQALRQMKRALPEIAEMAKASRIEVDSKTCFGYPDGDCLR